MDAVIAWTATILDRRRLAPGLFEIVLSVPADLGFAPGQHIRLGAGPAARDYSPVTPAGGQRLAVCVREVSGAGLSAQLAAAAPGLELPARGPYGQFLFRPSSRRPVFVATGTGIAPFVAMARAGARDFLLLHGVREAAELIYADVMRAVGVHVGCLSRQSAPPDAFAGRVTDHLRDRLEPGAYDFYLCGRGEMIRDALAILDRRFPQARVYYESFF